MALFNGKKKMAALPKDVEDRVKRGRDHAQFDRTKRRECAEFVRGNQYVYSSLDGRQLKEKATVAGPNGDGKPEHRVRLAHNILAPIVQSKVSMATQRHPSYSITASTPDAEAISGASLGEKVATAGYSNWHVDRATQDTVWNALVMDEGFAMAYWDTNIGPFVAPVDPETGKPVKEPVGLGDVRIWTGNANEVFWEPGVRFEDSRWYCIEHARPVDAVTSEPGYIGPAKLSPDASALHVVGRKEPNTTGNLVIVSEYMERPSVMFPKGRRLISADCKLLFPEEPYPCMDAAGEVVDRPCLHRMFYFHDAANDRYLGLVRFLLDPQRTINLANNKTLEWIQHALAPQVMSPQGALTNPITDEPGVVVEYDPMFDMPKWREIQEPPDSLFEVQERARAIMGVIAHENDIPSQVESGKAIESLNERDRIAWADFLVRLAEFHSGLMRDCLTLVQRHYTEERVLRFRGRTGWEDTGGFRGVDMRGQTDVHVSPASLEARTPEAIEQRVMNFAQLGWVDRDVAMSAIANGTGEQLIETYELDQMRAHKIVQQIRAGTMFELPPRPVFPGEVAPDPETGEPLSELPGWLPRPNVDNLNVHKQVVGDWLKTNDFEELPLERRQAGYVYFQALLDLEAKAVAEQQQAEAEQAAAMGMRNAQRPAAVEKPRPSMPAVQR